jgi:hypothetical protein
MDNKDHHMMKTCISEETNALFNCDCEYPLDKESVSKIKDIHDLMRADDDDYEIFRHLEKIDGIWSMLIEKAIKCLRYYDTREPFIENKEKKPKAYGLDELNKYYKEYKEFEGMLYGSSQNYRDHVVHVFRTWLSGVHCMVKNNGKFLKYISIYDEDAITLEYVEKLSIWTIIALTHDLGYPLEKAKAILNSTNAMVSTFMTNPDISMDLSFHGVQNSMNDFVVRLMSSKMVAAKQKDIKGNKLYFARLQSKYYFKFLKSLEKMKHGIVSALIIYKLLTYFLESDYNINEGYTFSKEDRRQFYIRREILRAIASHTCTDVYHLYIGSFAFLLIITDDTQTWGRKYISELYVPSNKNYELDEIKLAVSDKKNVPHKCTIKEKVVVSEDKEAKAVTNLLTKLRKQALNYVTIFRDGQETRNRDFSFIRKLSIVFGASPEIVFDMELTILNDTASSLIGEIKYSGDKEKNQKFDQDFIEKLEKETGAKVIWEVFDDNKKDVKEKSAENWSKGKIVISLAS